MCGKQWRVFSQELATWLQEVDEEQKALSASGFFLTFPISRNSFSYKYLVASAME